MSTGIIPQNNPAPISLTFACNTCKHNGPRWCQHPQAVQHPDAFWNRDNEEDAQGRPWCHSDRVEQPANEDAKRDH